MHGPQAGYLGDPFLDRVRRAYRLALTAHGPDSGPIWRPIDIRRANVHAALLCDNNAIRSIFADPVSSDLFYGTDGICLSIFGQLQSDEAFRVYVHNFARELIDRLGSILGLKQDEPERVIEQMDKALNQRLEFPAPFRGEIALPTSRGLVGERAIYAVYETSRLIDLLRNSSSKTVIEIGPGVGRTAYYGHRAGLDYTTVDLPLGIVAQACFLGATIGPDAVWLEGDDQLPSEGRVKLLSRAPTIGFDIALNVDSFTEMPPAIAFTYAQWIASHAECFLSINHEKNTFDVSEIMAFAGGSKRCSRIPCPIWPSYFEETFAPAGRPAFNSARLRALHAMLGARALLRRFRIVAQS